MGEYSDEREYPKVIHAGVSETEGRIFCITRENANRFYLVKSDYKVYMYEIDKNGNKIHTWTEDIGDLKLITRKPITYEELLGRK